MVVKKEDVTFDTNAQPNKKYSRTIYWCENDDIWVITETPLKNK